MADIVKLTTFNATSTQVTMSAGAASFTVPLGAKSDSRATLFVNNRSAVIARVEVDAGDGLLADLGDLTVDIAVGKAAAIPLGESMRFKVATTNDVTVNLNDTSDVSLTATPLALIDCVLIQG